ncbi:cation:proton antiporter [Kitasatospora sp. NPDC093806]|uniref:cation:proton antiporter n=1 Tax=Kitasatospora sp. NPDC093806 TaxID=3155075 RepID=UPI00343652A5
MDVLGLLLRIAHLAAALAVVLLIAKLGRSAAERLRQPGVIGEILAGLLAGPAALALLGDRAFDAALPAPVLDDVKLVAKAGLVLFLVGLAHKLRIGPNRPPRRATAWVSAGSLLPPLLTGVLLVGWVLVTGDDAARGGSPMPAFLLMTAVTMSITAVPVLARILADRGMSESSAGRLALSSAIVIDALGWLLLTVAIGLGAGDPAGSLRSALALLFGGGCALAIRFLLRTRAAQEFCARLPVAAATALGTAALAVAFTVEELGMTAILGAAAVGLAIPGDESAPWARAVASVTRAGRMLVPTFFAATGITVLNRAFDTASWSLILVTVLLGCLGKGLGGYLGARFGGEDRHTARRIGVLMNTRGLTELIVIQAGYAAGILTAPMVLALITMAVTTTVMTGPLLNLVDRRAPVAPVRPTPVHLPVDQESGAR